MIFGNNFLGKKKYIAYVSLIALSKLVGIYGLKQHFRRLSFIEHLFPLKKLVDIDSVVCLSWLLVRVGDSDVMCVLIVRHHTEEEPYH